MVSRNFEIFLTEMMGSIDPQMTHVACKHQAHLPGSPLSAPALPQAKE
jgi:hypothetical protein